MTELVELQRWSCPWCGDDLPAAPRGTAIDHIIPRIYGGPHRRWNLQLLHQECNSAKGKLITAEALELADAYGVTISMSVEQYRAGVRRRAVKHALRSTRQLGAQARDRALAAARDLTVFFPEAKVHAVIKAAAEGTTQSPGPAWQHATQETPGQVPPLWHGQHRRARQRRGGDCAGGPRTEDRADFLMHDNHPFGGGLTP